MKKGDRIARVVTKVEGDGEYTLEALVNWVVEDEAGITYLSPPDWKGGAKVVNLKEEEWKVTLESTPSFQSSVAEMSEEELRESIDRLRESRKHIPAPRVRGDRVKKDDPVSKAFAHLSKEKREEVMRKLGLL